MLFYFAMAYELSETQEHHVRMLAAWDMIRERSIEDYTTTLGYNPTELATAQLAANGSFKWFDMCCGDFNAGINLSHNTEGKAESFGIDLDTYPREDRLIARNTIILRGDVIDYPLPDDIDLITCVRGLFYAERLNPGGAAKALTHWYNALPIGSRLTVEIPQQMPRFQATIDSLSETFTGHSVGKWVNIETVLIDIEKTDQHPETIDLNSD
jgi:hypothetical protein